MKVLHVPFCFYPDPIGGTEVYVETLVREQQRRGLDVVIAAPGSVSTRYTADGLAVWRFATSSQSDNLYSLYGAGDVTARDAFGSILDHEKPEVVHLHAFTPAVSARLTEDAKRRGAAVVFTYHTPTVSCQRGTLLRWGTDVCDGVLDAQPCAACSLHGLGAARPVASLLGNLPPGIGRGIGRAGLAGGPWTALRMTDLVRHQHAAFREFVAQADRVVVLCHWASELLQRNGVPSRKLTLSRHGLSSPALSVTELRRMRSGPLRVAFLGRLHPTKGVDTLVRALRLVPNADVHLDIVGVVQDEASRAYERSLRQLAAGDARIRFEAPVSSTEVPSLIANYDVVAVPSRWLETGPLVVLEAFAAGRPVVGSHLGGIAELVTHNVDGVLVEPEAAEAWADALQLLATDAQLLDRLTAGVRPPRTIADVADEMRDVYSLSLDRTAVNV